MSTKTEEQLRSLIEVLRTRKLSVSFAESCTGGKLSAAFAEVPGVSQVYLGAVVSYANGVKVDLLGVRRDTLQMEGAVSESVARQMAQGVRRQLKSDWAVAITGIAGPDGGTPEKPVGTVCFSFVGPQFEESVRKNFSGDRLRVQKSAVDYAVEKLMDCVNNN